MTKQDKPHRVPTADDVALLAGVSRSAVSRTFTEGASVAPATREKVVAAARSLGYRVNFLARSLSRQRTNLIGLVVSDLDNPFRAAMMDQLARRLIDMHYRPFVLPTVTGGDTRHLIDMMLHYNVCGAVVTGDASPGEIAEACAAYGVPLTLINKPEVGPTVANVSMDMDKAGQLMAEELAVAGCRRIVLAGQARQSYSIGRRRESFLSHARRLGLDIVGDFRGPVQNYAGGVAAAKAFVASGVEADGIHCGNDYLALGFLDHLRRRVGMRIPEDIKVIGCDDIAEAGWLSYDLTTVRQDPSEVARCAVECLIEQIDPPEQPSQLPSMHRTVDVTLVRRGSTGGAPSSFRGE